ncbi:hypothetical protein AN641_06235 [Candidatus Epulonipiscioides gigas]|nr:hypothetical protein AN641_06235 [Epulopiscium sp. SCG-C07WGA-EpuloA2]
MKIEIEILQFLESIRNPFLNMLVETGTFSAEIFFLGSIIVTFYWCINKEFAYKLSFFVLFNALLTSCMKDLVRKPRPFELGIVKPLRVETAPGYSFPSGHTSTAVSFWGGAYCIIKKKSVLIFAILMSLIVGFTRIYLGVHFPIDVIGGFLLGIISIISGNFILKTNKLLLFSAGLAAVLALILPASEDIVMATSSLFGLIGGVMLEKKYINFEVRTTLKKQIFKLIIGIIGTAIIYFGLELIMLDTKFTISIKYMLLFWYITFGAPSIFKKFKFI